MFNLSKAASKLWLFSAVKDKDFICIGIKQNKKQSAHTHKKIIIKKKKAADSL